jgi:demethylmenaquinone methyltransferase/2-methoxy-6-polyprenyl-1,4-benzoquinol methylase
MVADRPGTDASVDFGFRRVEAGEKDRLVRGVFDQVSRHYDLMNDLMSAGLHRRWKAEFIAQLFPGPPRRLLDVAGGTGDIVFGFRSRLARSGEPGGRFSAVVVDANPSMLGRGRDRAIDRGIVHGIEWVAGKAEALPLPANSFDACTVSFGLRNATDLDAALREARRVLLPGGRFLCLEFSRPSERLGWLYDRYSLSVIPALGRLVVGDAAPYRYLVESIRRFPGQAEFSERLRAAGFAHVRHRDLSEGIVAIHSAYRI